MTVDSAEKTLPERSEPEAREPADMTPAARDNISPVWVEPDLDFIRALHRHGGESLKKCFQCGTCSGSCELSPEVDPFPRKEMAWVVWGMKDRLLTDPDIWLCYQCNDCSTRCPRGARPGDVLGLIRQECVSRYAVPQFLGRWVSQPHYAPLLLGIPAALLTMALLVRGPIERGLGMSTAAGEAIVYSYSRALPHWLLNTFFGLFSLLALAAMSAGVVRFWRAMKTTAVNHTAARPVKGLVPSILTTLGNVLTHRDFVACTTTRPRMVSHVCVFFGFVALTLVTIWVITAQINPLAQGQFIYPFGFWNPWKILANLGGVALMVGCLMMAWDRLARGDQFGVGNYADWALIGTLLLVVISGFVTEVLHYLRLEPHRHLVYFAHLVLVFALLIYLPYSKLAHLAYRGTALVFAEHYGRFGDTTDPRPAALEAGAPGRETHA